MKPRHWSRVRKLLDAADTHAAAGDLASARQFSAEALHLAFEHGGREDPGVAECFFQLGRILEDSGDLTGAEPNYNAACSILKPTEGEATPLKAGLLLAYGSLYLRMGLGWRAILLLEHAQGRFTEINGADDEAVGRCLSMIAVAFESVHMEDEAMAAYQEAIRILRAAWGPAHPSVAYIEWSRADLAFWRAVKGGDAQGVEHALSDFRAGLARLEEAAGRDHPDAARRRANLGTYLVVCDQFEEGARLLADAIAVLDAAGENVAAFCRQLATARARLGDPAEALALLRRSIHQDPVGHWVAHGSDRERMSALEKVRANLAQYLDLVLQAGTDDPAIVAEACDLVLSRKALGAELLATQRRAVSRGDDPELASLMAQLAELRAASAQASLAGAGEDETRVEIERLEWELASRVPEMDVGAALTAFTHETAAALLPDASVLIEFARFTRRTIVPADPDALEDGSRDWYVAFVIRSGEDAVRLVDLGAAPGIDALIRAYRDWLTRPGGGQDADGRNIIRSRAREASGVADAGDALRTRLFDPLLDALGDRTRLLIAPDGDLNRLSFEALPDAAGGWLVERFDISYLSAGRDLHGLASAPGDTTPGAPLVLADPDYDLYADPSGLPAAEALAATAEVRAGAPGHRPALRRDLIGAGIRFAALPGTREEGIAVAGLLHVEPLLGGAAREDRLKEARSPLVLHVATHGFFLAEPEHENTDPTQPAGGGVAAAAHNPLVRSGIALAGANAWLRGEPLPAGIQDGVLNGEDIISMDLGGTELVVLSACETGLGDVLAGEGVMGLRRAFAVAGARTLVLSLWKVPDEQTRILMTGFYEALVEGKGRAESLREAQRRVRAEYPSPFYWAAFICQGDPAPIPRFRAASNP